MKWYQHLFWKIFLSAWLLSSLLMGGLFWLLLASNANQHSRDMLDARAAHQAQLFIERYERGVRGSGIEMRHERERQDREMMRQRLAMQITHLDSGEVIQPLRGLDAVPALRSFALESDSGQSYLVELRIPPERIQMEQMMRFALSLQMLWVLLVAALMAFLVSILIVRPVNQLRRHARNLYDQQNLSSRAQGHLSQRQDEIGELAREFNRMADYVERTLTSQQRLLQDVSHELRAPMTRLQLAAGLLEQRAEANPWVDKINRECQVLTQLIDELLSWSRLEQQAQERASCSLFELLSELKEDAVLTHPQHHLSLQVQPKTLNSYTSPLLLKRILSNLLNNALKHTPAGTQIQIHALPSQAGCQVTMTDTGPGVDEAQLEQLFQPFVRGAASTGEGYGLGLSIVKRAVLALGGEIRLENPQEGGLRVILYLPDLKDSIR